jgi:hypothetical protein
VQCFAKETPRCQRTPGHHAREAGENFINVQGGQTRPGKHRP